MQSAAPDQFKAALNIELADPDALMTWLQGRGDIGYRSQKPLRLRGDVTVAPDGFAIGAMKAEIDGGTVEGSVAVSHRQTGSGVADLRRLEGRAQLDLDAATALVRSLAGPQGEWPDEGQLSLDIGRAISAGQELRPLLVKLGYSPKTLSLDQLKIGQPDSVTLEGTGSFDRVNAVGKLALDTSAASLGRMTALISPFAPSLAARIDAMGTSPGPASLKLTLERRQERPQARPRPCARRCRSRSAAAQGHGRHHRRAGHRGDSWL